MTFTSGTVTVTLPPNILTMDSPTITHWQNTAVTEDGTARVYNRGVNEWFIPCRLKITNTQRSNLRNFVKNTVTFANTTFTFTPDTDIDYGAGAGTGFSVRWWQDSCIERPVAPGIYEVSFVLRAATTGSANPS